MDSELPDDPLLAVLPLYRDLGFFAASATLSDAELAEHLRAQYRRGPGAPELRTDFPRWDMALLGWDEDRAYGYDTESAGRDLNSYADLVQGLARISRGAFRPTNVQEVWEGDFGPLSLRFEWQGQEHVVQLGEMETDFVEPAVLDYLEPLIQATTPYGVVHLATGDQTDLILLLSAEERARLERERPDLFGFENAYD